MIAGDGLPDDTTPRETADGSKVVIIGEGVAGASGSGVGLTVGNSVTTFAVGAGERSVVSTGSVVDIIPGDGLPDDATPRESAGGSMVVTIGEDVAGTPGIDVGSTVGISVAIFSVGAGE